MQGKMARKLMLTLLVTLSVSGCATQRTASTAPGISPEKAKEARCGDWRKLGYVYNEDAKLERDTKVTIGGIRRHNAYGHRRGCW